MGLIFKTYKAFTLWEAIIVMIITSTIVTLSYGSYQGFSLLLQADQKSMMELQEAVYLEHELFEMLESCKSVELIRNVIWFNGASEGTRIEVLDTTLVIFGMKGNEEREIRMLDWSAEYLDEKSDYVCSLGFIVRLDEQLYHFSFMKSYSRAFLLDMF